jgi:D-aminoacyl-tRNA deacylase
VEVGSTPKQWNDLSATNTVVDAVLNAIRNDNADFVSAVGFGGPHYAPLFTKMDIEEEYAIGHVFSKYVLSSRIKWDLILESFTLSDDAKIAILDWKSIKGSVRQYLREFLYDHGFEVIKR